jgi:hypothetical protein
VYDKVVKSKLKLKFDENNIDEFEKVVSVIKNRDFSFNENVLETDFYNILPFIPE